MSVILITGAATRVGRGVAHHLAEQGHHLLLHDADAHGAHDLARAIQAAAGTARVSGPSGPWGTAEFVPGDLGTAEGAERLVVESVSRFGHLDGAINTVWSAPAPGRLHELSADFWDATLAISLRELHLSLQAEIRHFLAEGTGVIVNVCSPEAVQGSDFDGVTEMAAHLTESISHRAAVEYAQDNLRVRSYTASAAGAGAGIGRIASILEGEIAVARSQHAQRVPVSG